MLDPPHPPRMPSLPLSFDGPLGQKIIELHVWAVGEGLRGAEPAALFDGLCSALLTLLRSAAIAEEVRVQGVTLPPTSPTPGAFRPAGTNRTSYGFDKDGRCWDGKAWHNVYPSGPRRYARAQGQVDCVVVTKATGDCWDGHAL